MQRIGERLGIVKEANNRFDYERASRRRREPLYYKLYYDDLWIEELWASEQGPVLWTNAVSAKEKENAVLLKKYDTNRDQDDLYIKESNVEKRISLYNVDFKR